MATKHAAMATKYESPTNIRITKNDECAHSYIRTKLVFRSEHGQILIPALVFMGVAVAVIAVLVNVAITSLSFVNRSVHEELAFQIAEAGIEYYRWHLAHAPTDYQNGVGQPGPYTLPFNDKNGVQIGQIILNITAPPVGSTVVTLLSKGTLTADPLAIRKIRAQLAIPSFAKYATVANADMRFGSGTEVFGQIHSNGGIRFDGVANNIVTSAQTSYDDPDHSGGNEFGVHTHVSPVDPLPPASVPTRADVFRAGRQFPVPAVDFQGITANLAQMKADAQAAGLYFGASGAQGYYAVLNVNDTMTLYRVNSVIAPPSNCTNVLSQSGWGTWSISTTTQTLLGTYNFPANGLIFFEDHAWVSGKINTARLTIASARFPESPSTNTSITFLNDLLYTNYDGQDVLALIAQNNINAGLRSQDVLRVDAALIAKNGRVGRYYYGSNCGVYYRRNTITLYGMIGTSQRYGFAYTDGTGYTNRIITYDANLLYSPPPSFPLTSDQYEIISWEEVR